MWYPGQKKMTLLKNPVKYGKSLYFNKQFCANYFLGLIIACNSRIYKAFCAYFCVFKIISEKSIFEKNIKCDIKRIPKHKQNTFSSGEERACKERIAKHISIPIYQLEHRYTCFSKILSKFQGLVLFHLLHHIPHFSVTSFSISTTFSKTDSCDSRVSKSPIFRYYLTGLQQTDQNLFSACSEECLDANMTVLTTHPLVSEAFTQNELLKLNNIRLLYK